VIDVGTQGNIIAPPSGASDRVALGRDGHDGFVDRLLHDEIACF